ncbi:MAG TPA: hypothetical protein EYP56_18910 [Planctomycetaceae bacterium]|nr:hypothetical protein [Planctomycetaceae bacterium]
MTAFQANTSLAELNWQAMAYRAVEALGLTLAVFHNKRQANDLRRGVPTPVTVGQRLLVSTENNGTRLYRFDAAGRIVAEPVAANEELIPDTSTPVVLDGLVYGSSGRLVCLDLNDSLKTLWDSDQKDFTEYCTLVAGRGRLLVVTQAGKLCLLKGSRSGLERIGTASLFDDVAETDREVWSHPALVGTRLYIRNLLGLSCFLLN